MARGGDLPDRKTNRAPSHSSAPASRPHDEETATRGPSTDLSSGPSGDLQAATILAAQMIGSLGMAGSLFSYEAVRMPNTDIVTRVVSSDDGKASIERKLETARSEVRVMLAGHRVVVEALRDALLDRHELIGDEILEVIRHADPATPLRSPL